MRTALAVGHTRAGGSVRGAARHRAAMPDGSWPQTEQAQEYLRTAVAEAAPAYNDGAIARASDLLVVEARRSERPVSHG